MVNNPEPMTSAQIRNRLLDYLSRREHSGAELYEKLTRRNVLDEEVFERVLQDLRDIGLQSDERCALWCLRKVERLCWGGKRLQRELEQRALSPDLLPVERTDWLQLAKKARAKRFGEQLPDTATDWQKQYRFLMARGFSSEQVHGALSNPCPEVEPEDCGYS